LESLLSFLDHFKHAHNADLQSWTPWFQGDALLGYVQNNFKERGLSFGLWQESEQGLVIPSLSEGELNQLFARFAKDTYEEGLLWSWVGEPFPVKASVTDPTRFVMERTLTAPLGCLTFGVHLNGYVRTRNGIELWVAKRSQHKPTFPGKLDNMVGGGQPAGLGLFENLLKECFEEAGISETQASQSIATGTISYRHTDGRGLKRDILYCYDLELPDSFVPVCQDGEVESFERLPIDVVLSMIETTDAFKYNCNLVIIDFAIRHGILTGDNTPDYAELCERRNQLAS
jgi:8-oxo-dGTP pyrophosphatase MutT (NUDIX family)